MLMIYSLFCRYDHYNDGIGMHSIADLLNLPVLKPEVFAMIIDYSSVPGRQ